jgi:transcriptional regulator with XRE-family HTH domain
MQPKSVEIETEGIMASISTAWSVEVMAQTKKEQSGETFGLRLARIRKQRGFTQMELGHALGVSQRVIAYYERESRRPPANLLPKIAAALNVSADALLGIGSMPDDGRTADARLRRRLRQLEELPTADRKAVIQVIDAMLDRNKSGNT